MTNEDKWEWKHQYVYSIEKQGRVLALYCPADIIIIVQIHGAWVYSATESRSPRDVFYPNLS